MPKESRRSISTPSSPYTGKTGSTSRVYGKKNLYEEEDKIQWGEVNCPICLEHPHNAVLLRCSSPKCRHFMCHTADLLSNCFEEFCRRRSITPLDGRFEGVQGPLPCPHCRGELTGWDVVEPARISMDRFVRNCSLNWCEFSGNFTELMEHVEKEHPGSRPRDEEEVGVEEDEDDDDEEIVSEEEMVEDDYEDEDDGIYDDYGLEMGEEDDYEGTVIYLKPGETFEDHIHFGGPDEQVLSEDVSDSNGVVNLVRNVASGKTYFYGGLREEVNMDRIRAM